MGVSGCAADSASNEGDLATTGCRGSVAGCEEERVGESTMSVLVAILALEREAEG